MSFFPEKKGGGFFGQGAFQVDPNATPEMIRAKREALAAMMPQYGRARYVGEGIGQLGTAIASNRQNSAYDKFEGEKRAEASKQYNSLLSGGQTRPAGPMSILGMAPPQNTADAKYPAGMEGPAPAGNIDPASGLDMGQDVGSSIPEDVRNGIFAGESGGDYNALFGFQNRDGGKFSDVKLTDMTVNQALDFSNPQGDYGQWVKGQVGRVATPMGAYQIVGTTLREASKALGLTGNEKMTTDLQDRLGAWIYENQGTGAWEGYKGPQDSFQPGPGTQVAQNSGPALNDLVMAAQNPWLSAEQRAGINTLIQQQQQQQQAMQDRQWSREDYLWKQENTPQALPASIQEAEWKAKQLGLTPGTPEYQDFIRSGGGSGGTDYGLQPVYGRDADGNIVVMQLGKNGEAVATQLPDGVTPDLQAKGFENAFGTGSGANAADIATGGAAEAAKDLGAASMAAGVGAWESYGKMQTSLSNIDNAISAIDSGAKSGVIYNMLPSVTEASASLENSMNRMGLDIVGAVTFGALSEGELRLAMNTAVPQNLGPAELRSWLVKRRDAQAKAAAMIADAAQYLTNPENNLNGWIEKNRAAQSENPQPTGDTTSPPESDAGTFEAFQSDPSAQAAAKKYGVTLEEMWEVRQGNK